MRRPVALPPACATRRTRWPPSSPSASRPWRSASKRTPSALEVGEALRRLGAQHLRRRAAHEAAAGGERVLEVQCRRVVDAPARRRGRPGPSRTPSRRAAGPRPAPPARPRRRRTARRTVRRHPLRRPRGPLSAHRARRATVPGMAAPSPAPLWLRHDSSFGHVIPGHPERPERIKRARGRAVAGRTGSAGTWRRRRPSSASSCGRCTRRRTSRSSRRCAPAAAARSTSTPRRWPTPGRPSSTPPAGRSRWSTRSCPARPPRASRACARPAITPSASGRWASASSTASRSRRATPRSSTASSA